MLQLHPRVDLGAQRLGKLLFRDEKSCVVVVCSSLLHIDDYVFFYYFIIYTVYY